MNNLNGQFVSKICLWFQELERQKHTCTVLQHKQEELKEGIRQRDELIEVRLCIRKTNLTTSDYFSVNTLGGVAVCRLQQSTVLCWNLIRIDLHWPASSSSPTLSLFPLTFSSVPL